MLRKMIVVDTWTCSWWCWCWGRWSWWTPGLAEDSVDGEEGGRGWHVDLLRIKLMLRKVIVVDTLTCSSINLCDYICSIHLTNACLIQWHVMWCTLSVGNSIFIQLRNSPTCFDPKCWITIGVTTKIGFYTLPREIYIQVLYFLLTLRLFDLTFLLL
jgi:hypothetical protein